MTLMCKKCNNHIGVEELKTHEKFHSLLDFFKFDELPKNEDALGEKRLLMIKNIGKTLNKKTFQWNRQISIINENYELLKSFVNNSFEINRILDPKPTSEAHGKQI